MRKLSDNIRKAIADANKTGVIPNLLEALGSDRLNANYLPGEVHGPHQDTIIVHAINQSGFRKSGIRPLTPLEALNKLLRHIRDDNNYVTKTIEIIINELDPKITKKLVSVAQLCKDRGIKNLSIELLLEQEECIAIPLERAIEEARYLDDRTKIQISSSHSQIKIHKSKGK